MKPLRDSLRWLAGTATVETGRRSGVALLIAAAVLIVVREPGLLIHPRLWAEEGSLYLATSLTLPWWKALLAVHKGWFLCCPIWPRFWPHGSFPWPGLLG